MGELRAQQTHEGVKGQSDKVILSLIAIKMLKTYFTKDFNEWRLVASKGAGYVKKNLFGADTLELLIEKVVLKTVF